jgi:hypothetical protein
MPALPVIVGALAGGLITFELTARRWSRRRRLRAREAACRLTPRLRAVDRAVADALAARWWTPLDLLDLTDHSLPDLAMSIVGDLPPEAAEPFADGVVALHELDRARGLLSLETPTARDEIEGYRRRIAAARTIATAVLDRAPMATSER